MCLAQNAVEQMTGDNNLIAVRSRAVQNRRVGNKPPQVEIYQLHNINAFPGIEQYLPAGKRVKGEATW